MRNESIKLYLKPFEDAVKDQDRYSDIEPLQVLEREGQPWLLYYQRAQCSCVLDEANRYNVQTSVDYKDAKICPECKGWRG